MRLIDADALKARFTEELFERSGLSAQGIIDEAPTIEPSGDLISRADAITEFREWVKRANENGETPTWNDAVSLIGSLPSAEYSKPLQTTLNGDLISKADAIDGD